MSEGRLVLRLFNTLTQRVEPLRPVGDEVTLYVCGITPYDTTHLGHAFINVIYDTLVRHLRWQGLAVRYVQNVTDIDDDVLRKARELGIAWDELGRRETDRYLTDLHALHVLPPTHYVRATDEIGGMVRFIQTLIEQRHAYVRDGWVYFSVTSDPGFGALAEAAGYHGYAEWLATANERGNFPDDPRKADPLDFVLWQAQQAGEPAWPSPWGPGRPGWHIECSSMSVQYLGPHIDIHGGGADLIFPHHTCEIAQSENATGVHPFVSIWMHCAMVYLDGEKMSKSLGNLILVRNLLREYSPDAIRTMLLSHHYREAWEYTTDNMRESAALVGRLVAAAQPIAAANALALSDVERDEVARQARDAFIAALEDDFNTPAALRVLDGLANATHDGAAAARVATLMELAEVFGLTLSGAADPAATATRAGQPTEA